MRILVVTSDLPFPPIWGAATRNYQFLKWIAARHSVSLVSYEASGGADGIASLKEIGISVHTVHRAAATSKRLSQLRSVISSRSHLGGIQHHPAMQGEIDRLLARARFDAVLVEGSLLTRFDFGVDVPMVLDEHNVEYEVLKRTYRTERSPLRKCFGMLEYHKFRREEVAAWRRASWVVFTSERERQMMHSDGVSTRSTVVFNGVDLDYLEPSPGAPDANAIVFTGRIDYRPNTDAVLYFVREVLQLVHRERPEVVLTVVGGDVPRVVERLAGPRVHVTGRVPDVRPYWRRAAVAIAPIRFGGGTRLKVVEAMAMARPVVSTSLGCEGIDAVSGEHLLVADSPREFADAILRLLEDPGLAEALGRRGRALVEAEYAWHSLAGRLEDVLLQAANARGIMVKGAAAGNHSC
jgi:polysaccharide biosynthesis protein PslH